MLKIIGISGKKQTGKDTLASAIRSVYGINRSARIAFADELKAEVAAATGKTVEFIEQNKMQFRPVLQWWGTDFRRNFSGKHYWVYKAFQRMLELPPQISLVVIPDVRFESEADYIREVGGMILRVDRPDLKSDDKHPSETELDNYVWFVERYANIGSVEDMNTFAMKFLREHGLVK